MEIYLVLDGVKSELSESKRKHIDDDTIFLFKTSSVFTYLRGKVKAIRSGNDFQSESASFYVSSYNNIQSNNFTQALSKQRKKEEGLKCFALTTKG